MTLFVTVFGTALFLVWLVAQTFLTIFFTFNQVKVKHFYFLFLKTDFVLIDELQNTEKEQRSNLKI